MKPTDVMEILSAPTGAYPRGAVQAAMDHRDEMVPLLLLELENACEDPHRYLEKTKGSFLPIHVLVLLGYHRVPEAHSHMIELARLPGEMPFDLFGDAIHEVLPKALWNTCEGETSNINELVRDAKANQYCRYAAISALLFGVAEQRLPREEMIEFLQGLFTGDESDIDQPMVWNAAASALANLWPGESMDVLRKGYEDGLIDPGFISLGDIERYLERGKEAALARFTQSQLDDLNRTPHEDLSHWAAFRRTSTTGLQLVADAHKQQKDRQKAKRKRKQARSARKRSRGGKKRK